MIVNMSFIYANDLLVAQLVKKLGYGPKRLRHPKYFQLSIVLVNQNKNIITLSRIAQYPHPSNRSVPYRGKSLNSNIIDVLDSQILVYVRCHFGHFFAHENEPQQNNL